MLRSDLHEELLHDLDEDALDVEVFELHEHIDVEVFDLLHYLVVHEDLEDHDLLR